jgi:hypothetical protein
MTYVSHYILNLHFIKDKYLYNTHIHVLAQTVVITKINMEN